MANRQILTALCLAADVIDSVAIPVPACGSVNFGWRACLCTLSGGEEVEPLVLALASKAPTASATPRLLVLHGGHLRWCHHRERTQDTRMPCEKREQTPALHLHCMHKAIARTDTADNGATTRAFQRDSAAWWSGFYVNPLLMGMAHARVKRSAPTSPPLSNSARTQHSSRVCPKKDFHCSAPKKNYHAKWDNAKGKLQMRTRVQTDGAAQHLHRYETIPPTAHKRALRRHAATHEQRRRRRRRSRGRAAACGAAEKTGACTRARVLLQGNTIRRAARSCAHSVDARSSHGERAFW